MWYLDGSRDLRNRKSVDDDDVRDAHCKKGYWRTRNKSGLIYAVLALRAAEWSLKDIAAEVKVSLQRVSKICQDYRVATEVKSKRLVVLKMFYDMYGEECYDYIPLPQLRDTMDKLSPFGHTYGPSEEDVRNYGWINRIEELLNRE